eukprot:scaffold23195_cov51-Attheya_sp.AAC.5
MVAMPRGADDLILCDTTNAARPDDDENAPTLTAAETVQTSTVNERDATMFTSSCQYSYGNDFMARHWP